MVRSIYILPIRAAQPAFRRDNIKTKSVKTSDAVRLLKNPLKCYSMYIADRLWGIVVGCMIMFFYF